MFSLSNIYTFTKNVNVTISFLKIGLFVFVLVQDKMNSFR